MNANHDINRLELRKIDELFYELIGDVISATELWHQRDDGFSRRVYIKSAFSFLEGVTHLFKQAAIIFDNLNDSPVLNPEEIVLLKEESLGIDDKGNLEKKRAKIRTLANFKFSMVCYAKVRNINLTFDNNQEGWQYLKQAIEIRNRITHPHKIQSLNISSSDLNIVEAAMSYVRTVTIPLLGDEVSMSPERKITQ